jgi:hypothetical protein
VASPSFLHRILSGFVSAFDPLREAIASPDAFTAFLREFGWTLAPADTSKGTGSLSGISALTTNPSSLTTEQLASQIGAAVVVIRKLATSGMPAAIASTLPADVIDYLVYLSAARSPMLFGLLHFVGVISEQRVPANTATGRAEYVARQIHWDRLSGLVDRPLQTIQGSYGWGTSFDADAFLRSVAILLRGFGGVAGMYPTDSRLIAQYYSADNAAAAGLRSLVISPPFLDAAAILDGASFSFNIALLGMPIPPTATAATPVDGLVFMPVITGKANDAIALSDTVSMKLGGDFLSRPVRAEIHPTSAVVRGSAGDAHVSATARVDAKAPSGRPWIPVGDAGSTRFEVSAMHGTLGMDGKLDGDLDLTAEIGIDAASLVIDLGQGDGFLRGTVGSQPSTSAISFTVKYSTASGLSFSGQPGLSITIPLGLSLGGVVTLISAGITVGVSDGPGVHLDGTLSLSTSIGPIGAVVTDTGLRMLLTFPAASEPPGNLGSADVQFRFKSPTGAGLSVDTGGVSGGGFLKFDDAKHEYAGILQLQFTDLELQAFGLITTQVASAAGYSLLALIDANFPPVQLGWGFTLNGVGGLLAMHRTASVDALRAAVKTDSLSTILFPKNAIANAPQILSQLDAFFPRAPGRFLFGPMVQIGWGTPNVLTASLALVVELPEPIRLLLLARLTVMLPSPSEALVNIKMDALGVLDFSKSELALDASLYDSHLLSFSLSGDMALRANWGGQREFLLAIGGFHPRFQPPAGFPALKRITIDMPSGIVSTLRLQAYLAVTSNTLQFGASLDVFIGVSGFGLAGHLGFDALLQMDPFHFDADVSGSMALTAGGDNLMSVGLDATLSGPAPWHIAGKFKFSILFWDVHVSFSQTWGAEAVSQPVSTVDVGQLLGAALGDVRNWGVRLASGIPALISARNIDTPGLVAHPLAQLEAHEQIVPLGLDFTRFGAAVPAGARRFDITAVGVSGASVAHDAVEDDFAPAQFFDLSDEQKLARPSFEQHDAGVRFGFGIGTGQDRLVKSGSAQMKQIAYEASFIDMPDGTIRPPATPLTQGTIEVIFVGGAADRAVMLRAGRRKYGVSRRGIIVAEPKYVVVDSNTLTVANVGAARGDTYSSQWEALKGELGRSPQRRGQLEIVGLHEVGG